MNAYRQLLVHMDAGTRNIPRLRAARDIAREHGSEVTSLYAVTTSSLEVAASPDAVPALVATLAELDEERLARARKAFEVELSEPGPRATWSQASGLGTVVEFVRQALYADLLVLGQSDPSDPSSVPRDFNETVIMESGKPALVVPYTGLSDPIGRTVAIAWKETPQAARAVAAAIPLLQRARAVHVLQWGGEAASTVGGHALDLRGYLRLSEIEVTWHDEGGDEPGAVGELALSRASDLGADLLVMGCYGHSRARELVLGGMSRTILKSMTLPVLMAH